MGARIGQLYPSGGLCDYELQLMAPKGVQLTPRDCGFDNRNRDDSALDAVADLIADAVVDLIAFNCTAVSMVASRW